MPRRVWHLRFGVGVSCPCPPLWCFLWQAQARTLSFDRVATPLSSTLCVIEVREGGSEALGAARMAGKTGFACAWHYNATLCDINTTFVAIFVARSLALWLCCGMASLFLRGRSDIWLCAFKTWHAGRQAWVWVQKTTGQRDKGKAAAVAATGQAS